MLQRGQLSRFRRPHGAFISVVEVSTEPVSRQFGDSREGAGLREEVGGMWHDLKTVDAPQLPCRLAVEIQHLGVSSS